MKNGKKIYSGIFRDGGAGLRAKSRFRDRRRANKELGVWRLIVSTDRRLFEAEIAQRRWKRPACLFRCLLEDDLLRADRSLIYAIIWLC